MRDVLLALATDVTTAGRRRISYHDLGVEQLGSVYERVLEHEPARDGSAIVLTRTSNQAKDHRQLLHASGADRIPGPAHAGAARRGPRPPTTSCGLRIVDPAMGSGAFLVAACVFLSDACEHALIRDGQWSAADVSAADRAPLRRQVAERCLYGVDLNPTAVQLARVSLWLTTLAADRPLTFLDHHLATGNSLIGAWLRDLSRPPVSSRRPRALRSAALRRSDCGGRVAGASCRCGCV